jgi:positive regulator of sigma E activity
MTKFGQVLAYDENKGIATIGYSRPDACEKCGACGAQSHQGSITLKVECRPGDWVRVELPQERFLQATAFAYVLPLIGLLGGLALGFLGGGGADGPTLLGGCAGLGISLLLLWLNEKRIQGRPEWTPRVTQVYHEKPSLEDLRCDGKPTAFQR